MLNDYQHQETGRKKPDNKSLAKVARFFLFAGILILILPYLLGLFGLHNALRGSALFSHFSFSRFGMLFVLAAIFLFRTVARRAMEERNASFLAEHPMDRYVHEQDDTERDVYTPEEAEVVQTPPAAEPPADADEAYGDHAAFRPRRLCYECGMSNDVNAVTCIQCGHRL